MDGAHPNPFGRQRLGEDLLALWQETVDLLAQACGVPVGLIMRVDGPEIEVFVSSDTEGNPYAPGSKEEYLGSGLYCEWVVKNEAPLRIPNALKVPAWSGNPDVKLEMISYLGMPILRPDGKVFGTVCILDRKENEFGDVAWGLVDKFRRLAESTLRQVFLVDELRAREEFIDRLAQVFPICSYCKQVRSEGGRWVSVERYVEAVSGRRASHGICPDCHERARADLGLS